MKIKWINGDIKGFCYHMTHDDHDLNLYKVIKFVSLVSENKNPGYHYITYGLVSITEAWFNAHF